MFRFAVQRRSDSRPEWSTFYECHAPSSAADMLAHAESTVASRNRHNAEFRVIELASGRPVEAPAYEPAGPFSQSPQAGFARILQPSQVMETGAPFSSYMPLPQALAWARDLATRYGRPYRVVA